MKIIYNNWAVHNIIGHPLMYILYCMQLKSLASMVHDCTLPEE